MRALTRCSCECEANRPGGSGVIVPGTKAASDVTHMMSMEHENEGAEAAAVSEQIPIIGDEDHDV